MNKNRLKSLLKTLLKLSITIIALYFVFQKIDFEDFKRHLLNAQPVYLVLAFIAFNISKILSSFRILRFYNALNINLPLGRNISLYYLGMFYNLFLPGAIGGDGYKVYLLKQANKDVKTKQLVSATLLDRLSGLAAIFILGLIFLLFISEPLSPDWLSYTVILLALLVLPVFFLVIRFIFPAFKSVFNSTSLFSFGVQGAQVVASLFLLFSLDVQGQYMDYLALFLASSVVSVLPFTVGGVGARELVFLYGYQYLDINEDKAIAFTILFFLISAGTALIGLLFSLRIKSQSLTSN